MADKKKNKLEKLKVDEEKKRTELEEQQLQEDRKQTELEEQQLQEDRKRTELEEQQLQEDRKRTQIALEKKELEAKRLEEDRKQTQIALEKKELEAKRLEEDRKQTQIAQQKKDIEEKIFQDNRKRNEKIIKRVTAIISLIAALITIYAFFLPNEVKGIFKDWTFKKEIRFTFRYFGSNDEISKDQFSVYLNNYNNKVTEKNIKKDDNKLNEFFVKVKKQDFLLIIEPKDSVDAIRFEKEKMLLKNNLWEFKNGKTSFIKEESNKTFVFHKVVKKSEKTPLLFYLSPPHKLNTILFCTTHIKARGIEKVDCVNAINILKFKFNELLSSHIDKDGRQLFYLKDFPGDKHKELTSNNTYKFEAVGDLDGSYEYEKSLEKVAKLTRSLIIIKPCYEGGKIYNFYIDQGIDFYTDIERFKHKNILEDFQSFKTTSDSDSSIVNVFNHYINALHYFQDGDFNKAYGKMIELFVETIDSNVEIEPKDDNTTLGLTSRLKVMPVEPENQHKILQLEQKYSSKMKMKVYKNNPKLSALVQNADSINTDQIVNHFLEKIEVDSKMDNVQKANLLNDLTRVYEKEIDSTLITQIHTVIDNTLLPQTFIDSTDSIPPQKNDNQLKRLKKEIMKTEIKLCSINSEKNVKYNEFWNTYTDNLDPDSIKNEIENDIYFAFESWNAYKSQYPNLNLNTIDKNSELTEEGKKIYKSLFDELIIIYPQISFQYFSLN